MKQVSLFINLIDQITSQELILEKTYSTSSENKNSLSDSKEKEVDQMKLYPEQKKNGNFSEVKIGGHEEKEDVIPVSCSNPQASTPSGN